MVYEFGRRGFKKVQHAFVDVMRAFHAEVGFRLCPAMPSVSKPDSQAACQRLQGQDCMGLALFIGKGRMGLFARRGHPPCSVIPGAPVAVIEPGDHHRIRATAGGMYEAVSPR